MMRSQIDVHPEKNSERVPTGSSGVLKNSREASRCVDTFTGSRAACHFWAGNPSICLEIDLAEGVGFEPTVALRLLLISSQVPLTTQPPFRSR
jgi:hypothetical protein